MTLAELKRRLAPGTKVTLIHSAMGPCEKRRTVARLLSKQVAFQPEGGTELSYLPFPAAKDIRETADGFEVHFPDDSNIMVAYRWGWVDHLDTCGTQATPFRPCACGRGDES